MTWLLDGNVLLALAIDTHADHHRCVRWFAREVKSFATCVITQGTLLRIHMRLAADSSAQAAWEVLRGFVNHRMHTYLSDAFPFTEVSPFGLIGHRQVTDAWLAELARRRQGKLATLDAALVTLHPDVAAIVPVL